MDTVSNVHRPPRFRGSQTVTCTNSKIKPTQVIPAGNQRFAIASKNGSVQLVWVGKKPSLHLEVLSKIYTESTSITAMHYIGDRFNFILTGNWNTNVEAYSCANGKQMLSIRDHSDSIVAIDHITIATNKLLLLVASKNGKITVHRYTFIDHNANDSKPKMLTEVESVELVCLIDRHDSKIKNACLLDERNIVVHLELGSLLLFDLEGIKKAALKTTCNLPIVHIVKSDTSVFASVSSGMIYCFPGILQDQVDASTAIRASNYAACQLFPSSSSHNRLSFVDPDHKLHSIFTQVSSQSDKEGFFPFSRTLIGHKASNKIVSVASTNAASISIDSLGDIKVWFTG